MSVDSDTFYDTGRIGCGRGRGRRRTALTDGSVNVAYGATQADKTAAVQSYVNGLLSNTVQRYGWCGGNREL